MPRKSNQKLKLLRLMQILMEKTDDQNTITVPQMIEELSNYGISAERKSIYDDLELLDQYGLDIQRSRSQTFNFFIGERDFQLAELKLLVDLVQSSKFITRKKSAQLISKLEKLTSTNNAKQLQRQVYIIDRAKTLNEQIYYNVDAIHAAIAANKKISFRYYEWVIVKQNKSHIEKRMKLEGKVFVVNPVSLIWSDEKYYLITYRGSKEEYTRFPDEKFIHYRVDEMADIQALEEQRETPGFDFNVAEYSKSLFSMYSGEERRVVLLCENSLLGAIVDRYGKGISIKEVDSTHFQVAVKAAVSDMFFAFIMGRGSRIKIISPQSVVDQFKLKIDEIRGVYENE